MRTRTRKKKVQFFEVCDENNSAIVRALPWEEVFSRIARQPATARSHPLYGVTHWGQVYPLDNRDHFALARLREDGVSTFDIEQDQIVDQESQAANPYVELSIISVLPGTNKFGFLRGSNAASHAASFGDWLNKHGAFNREVTVVPLISRRTQEKIDRAHEVKLLDVRYSPETSQTIASAVENSEGLSTALDSITQGHAGADIEIILRQKGRAGARMTDVRRTLADTMRWVATRPFSKAVANIVEFDSEGRAHQERVDFLHDTLALRMDVSVVDDAGNPVRVPSAIAAISRAEARLRSELYG